MNKKILLFISPFVALGIFFSYQRNQVNSNYLWKDKQGTLSQSSSRAPANFVKQNLEIYKDYFQFNGFNRFIEYDLKLNFLSDKKKDKIKEKTKKALQQAITDTFGAFNPEASGGSGLVPLFKKNISGSFVQHFIKNLYILKIMDGNFAFDLDFVPRQNQQISYLQELGSNQLINLENKGTLLSHLQEKEKSLLEKVLHTSFPNDGSNYQYVGGKIRIHLEVLDLSWNPLDPIPNPKENAIKGSIQYRRFFRVNNSGRINVDLQEADLKIESTAYVKGNDSNQVFLTVDVNKTFNLGGMVPQATTTVVEFGKLKTNKFGSRSFVSRIFGGGDKDKKKDFHTGDFKLYGTISEEGKTYETNIQFDKLVYDMKKRRIDKKKSKISVKIMNSRLSSYKRSAIIKKIEDYFVGAKNYHFVTGAKLVRLVPELLDNENGGSDD